MIFLLKQMANDHVSCKWLAMPHISIRRRYYKCYKHNSLFSLATFLLNFVITFLRASKVKSSTKMDGFPSQLWSTSSVGSSDTNVQYCFYGTPTIIRMAQTNKIFERRYCKCASDEVYSSS